MQTTASKSLYGLLDSLIALRMEYANGTDGDEDLSPLGRAKVHEVRAALDTAIHAVKLVIDDIHRPPKNGDEVREMLG